MPEDTEETMEVTNCTCANLRKATRIVTQIYDAALKPTGLRTTQFTLLTTVQKMGELPMNHLAEALGMERTTLTRNIKPLVNRGLIEIEHETDRRIRRVRLSEEGDKILKEAHASWEIAQTTIVQSLGTERWSVLSETLGILVNAVQKT